MRFREDGFRPGDERGFLHKKLLGLVSKVSGFVPLPGAQIVSRVTGALARPKARPTISRTLTARPSVEGFQGQEFGRQLKFGGDGEPAPFRAFGGRAFASRTAFAPGITCPPPARINPATGRCEAPTPGIRGRIERFLPGGRTGFAEAPDGRPAAFTGPVGDAVMGQFGAALVPGTMVVERSVCLPGMQLAKDGLCYNKGAITNSQRLWPRGRRPLLTGGDMRAIGVAARAGAKLDRTTKRLRSLGMMKALPSGRKRAAPHAHAKPVAAVSV